jgi:hypothetical protein
MLVLAVLAVMLVLVLVLVLLPLVLARRRVSRASGGRSGSGCCYA